MSRTDNVNMKTHLSGTVLTTCHCVKITLSDNSVVALTQHDRDLVVGGVTYKSDVGFTPSTVKVVVDLAVDNAEATSSLTLGTFTEGEVNSGYLDGALIELLLVNWADTTQFYTLIKGSLGQVERSKNEFKVELRSTKDLFKKNTGRVYSSTCDALLGDARCTKNVTTSQFRATAIAVTSVSNNLFIKVASALSSFSSGWFNNGVVAFTSGANAGKSFAVRSNSKTGTEHLIELWQRPFGDVLAGDLFTVTAGCNKDLATCTNKFSNTVNFRGFPYIPTSERVTSYIAKGGEVLDGKSLYR